MIVIGIEGPTHWLWMNMPEVTWGTVLKQASAEQKQTQTLMEPTPHQELDPFCVR